jgi:hypothetical protein
MNKLWMCAVVVGALALGGAMELAQAQNKTSDRWCFKNTFGGSDCSYHSLAQCKASRPPDTSCFRARSNPRPKSQ